MSESSLIKLQALRTVTLLKKTPAQVFYCEFCELSKNTYFVDDYEGLVLKHQCAFLKTPFFTEHLQWLLQMTVSGFQPATLLKRDSRKDVIL